MPEVLTAQQITALDDLVVTAQECNVDIRSRRQFAISYGEELRPGRGHTIEVFYVDSDHLVTALFDPDGNGSPAVASLTVIHNAADEDCRCRPCVSALHAQADA